MLEAQQDAQEKVILQVEEAEKLAPVVQTIWGVVPMVGWLPDGEHNES